MFYNQMLNFLDNLNENISVACNDAGAANIILHWIKLYDFKKLNFCLSGPALQIFKKEFPNLKNNSLDDLIKKKNILFSGTSWSSSLEHNARKFTSLNGLYSIGVIDHWTNYVQRFTFNDEFILPNEIWVTDQISYKIAKKVFFGTKIRMLPNLYENFQIKQIQKNKEFIKKNYQKSKTVLYVLEPIREKWERNHKLPGEFQALEFFIKNLKLINLNKNCNIVLRLHPSETRDKYVNWIKTKSGYNIKISNCNSNLYEDIAKADWVVGCNSYALVIALKAKIKVACTLPPHAPDCILPFPEIIKLKEIII